MSGHNSNLGPTDPARSADPLPCALLSDDDGEQRWHVADAVRVELLAEEVCTEALCDEWLPLELR